MRESIASAASSFVDTALIDSRGESKSVSGIQFARGDERGTTGDVMWCEMSWYSTIDMQVR